MLTWEEKEKISENNLLLKTLLRHEINKLIVEIESIGVDSMTNLTVVSKYSEMIKDFKAICAVGGPMEYTPELYDVADKLMQRENELYLSKLAKEKRERSRVNKQLEKEEIM